MVFVGFYIGSLEDSSEGAQNWRSVQRFLGSFDHGFKISFDHRRDGNSSTPCVALRACHDMLVAAQK
jgi:hypothetical protein